MKQIVVGLKLYKSLQVWDAFIIEMQFIDVDLSAFLQIFLEDVGVVLN